MVEIAKNSFYHISLNTDKNRIYMKMCGTWETKSQVPHFLKDITLALATVKPGFSVVSDIRELEECSIDAQELHVQWQKQSVEAGILQLAEIHKLNDPVSELAISLAYESKISLNIFENEADAEAWLDDIPEA